jgi:hypothetical protein
VRETAKHQRAFEVYFSLGPNRSLSMVASKLGVSVAAVKKWSREFGWQQRVADRDMAVSGLVRERVTKVEVDRRSRNRQIVQAGIIATARAIAEGRIKPTLADLDRMIRLELVVEHEGRPGPEDRDSDILGLSREELLAKAEEEKLRLDRVMALARGLAQSQAAPEPGAEDGRDAPSEGPDPQ